MPTEIERTPKPYMESVPCLRMSFEEFIKFIEGMGIDESDITAYAKNVRFDGLNDIKSAPSRFSGESEVILSKKLEGDNVAYATISFNKKTTIVSEGSRKWLPVYEKVNYDFSKHIYEELIPFSNKLEYVTGKVTRVSFLIAFILALTLIFEVGAGTKLIATLNTYRVQIIAMIIMVYFLSMLISYLLSKRIPIKYNPRKTFWDRHGESTAVGACATLFTAFIFWYFTGSSL